MRIISRGEWGARYGDGKPGAANPAREIWLHHSVTAAPDLEPPFSDDYAAIRQLEEIGASRFGREYGISYTFPITPAGLIFEGHDVRKLGAHTRGHNTIGRAICFVGNYERRRPTDEQLNAAAWLLRHGYDRGWWTRRTLNGGHRDVSATACPGRHAYARIDDINRRARTGDFEEDDFMAMFDNKGELRDFVFNAVWRNDQIPSGHEGNPEWTAETFLRNIEKDTDAASVRKAVSQVVEAPLREMSATIATLAADRGQAVDVDALVARIEAAIESVSVRLEVEDEQA